jgi:mono/diheme cytochrome c family protein
MVRRSNRGKIAIDGATLIVTSLAVACGSAHHNGPWVIDEHDSLPLAPVSNDDDVDAGDPRRPPPAFGATTSLANAPPPISGGTLIITADDSRAVASDPDRDRVYIVDLKAQAVTTVQLLPHDEPGRLVEDEQGLLHVLLRSGGALLTLGSDGTVLSRKRLCPAPRGIDYDAADKRLVVACEGGEVYAAPPSPSESWALLTKLGSGLRDVVVVPGKTAARADKRIYVSRFRTAEVVELDADGNALVVARPAASNGLTSGEAAVAWRLIRMPDGPPAVLHQFASNAPVVVPPPQSDDGGTGPDPSSQSTDDDAGSGFAGEGTNGSTPGYGGGGFDFTMCTKRAIVRAAVTGLGGSMVGPDQLVLPVDGVRWRAGYAIVAAGNGHTSALPKLFMLAPSGADCASASSIPVGGQPIAIALAKGGELWIQSREPAQLEDAISHAIIPLASDSREDTGHAIFHSNSGAGIACASCHAEGGDDAHVWSFSGIGVRRTPSLRGTVAGTAPYHWSGDMTDISKLADAVMTQRMGGPKLASDQKSALASWLYAIPPPAHHPAADAESVARGRALFDSATVGCASCHSGAHFTNSATVDVGTGRAFQVPPLVGVGLRAPYLHDGCAATLTDRFGSCGGSRHGNTRTLSSSQIADLVAYLESL